MKFKWSKITEYLKQTVPIILKQYLVPLILNAVGLAGGVWTWVVGFILNRIWGKYIFPMIKKFFWKKDKENVDQKNITEYKKDIQQGATVEELKKDELAILNGSESK